MDFYSSFPAAPTRYAFDDSDDSDDEDMQQDTQGQQSIILKYAPSSSARKTLVIGVTGAGSVLLNALNGERKIVGEVVLSGGDAKPSAFPILEFASTNFLLLPCNEAISTEQAFSWTKAVLEGITTLERVIVLDTFTAAGYITAATREDDLQPPCLRVLNTSAASPVQNLIIYEPPNLAKGLSAAILNHTEIRSIPAYLILSLQESSYGKTLITDETLAAFVDGLRMLGLGTSVEYSVAQQQARKLGSKLDGRVDQHHHRLYL